MFSFLQSFTLRSILTTTILFLGIVAIHVIIAEIYDGGEMLGQYEWNEPPTLTAIILAGLYIVGWPVYSFFIKPWLTKRKKQAEAEQKLRDF